MKIALFVKVKLAGNWREWGQLILKNSFTKLFFCPNLVLLGSELVIGK